MTSRNLDILEKTAFRDIFLIFQKFRSNSSDGSMIAVKT